MDFEILPQLIIIFSMAGILAIIGKNFSKMKEAGSEEIFLQEDDKEKKEKEKFLYLYKRAVRRLDKESYQKKMADFWLWSEKFLRKLRILVLKLDTRMLSLLEQLRKRNSQSLENFKKRAEMNTYGDKAAETFSKFWSHNIGGKKTKAERTEMNAENVDAKPQRTEITVETKVSSTIIAAANLEEKSENEPLDETEAYCEDQKEETEEIAAEEIYKEVYEEEEQKMPLENKEEYFKESVKETAEPIEETANPSMAEIEQSEEYIAETQETAEIISEKKVKEVETEEEIRIRTRKEQEYIEILMKNPTDIKAYWKLGLIYSKRRNYEDALACFRQIVKIDPTYTKAKQKAIELMEKMKGRVK